MEAKTSLKGGVKRLIIEGQGLSELINEVLAEKKEALNYRVLRLALIELKAEIKDAKLSLAIEEYLVQSFAGSPNDVKAKRKLESIINLIPRNCEVSCVFQEFSDGYFLFEQFEMKLK